MKAKVDYSLYLVTDSNLCSWEDMPRAVEEAILGGVTLVQIREKDVSTLDFYQAAKKVKEVTDKYHVPLIINDRVDIAMALDAAGVHVGQTDMPATEARKLMGKDKILGVSAGTLEEALKAQEDGADYIGFGAVFYTSTKAVPGTKGPEKLAEVKNNLSIPVVAIGGIHQSNAREVLCADGIAVVSAIMGTKNERKAAEELCQILKEKK